MIMLIIIFFIIIIFIYYIFNLSKKYLLVHENDYNFIKEYLEGYPEFYIKLYNDKEIIKDNYNEYLCVRRIPQILNKSNYISSHYLDILNGPKFLNINKNKLSFLNLDQLTDPDDLKTINHFLKKFNIKYYDYSLYNIKLIGFGTYLPYKYNINEIIKLKKFLNVPKIYDVIMIGTESSRRNEIVNHLMQKKINIIFISNIFGDDRDKIIGKAKILLNIHGEDNFKIYENIRCERWRFAGMTIISEKCIDNVPKEIITCKYEDIVDTIINVLKKI
jgi:hypothetical protein